MLDPSVCTLKGSKLFEKLSAEAISKIETMCNWQEYGPDEAIIDASIQPPRDAVYFIVSGAVRVATSAGQSGEIAFIDLGEGAQFGELSAIDGQPRSANVYSRGRSVIASIEADQFNEIVGRSHGRTRASQAGWRRLGGIPRAALFSVHPCACAPVRPCDRATVRPCDRAPVRLCACP
ncbi:MAG: CRP/FNR family transcriptional regulator, cyclic AMP receptor protein, partial [Alphaproteobacteria bacterium]|nr:CRP/FNR family transcriptional regulator, cyclic AMP receptor protein [Alphaproteobacteria bacterium]